MPDRIAFPRCSAGTTIREASVGLVEDLFERWELPSVYLLVDGRLRCQGSRGYFQVSDGFTPTTGVIGRVVTSGVREVIEDVRLDPSFVAAIPGLRSEACVPVLLRGEVVGAVNLESRSLLDGAAVEDLERAAALLGRRIEDLGGLPAPSLAERLARVAVSLSSQTDAVSVVTRAVEGACDLSGMSTAAVAQLLPTGWRVTSARGPLADTVSTWDHHVLDLLSTTVGAGTASYFPDGEALPAGYEFLGHGIHALAVQPLVVARQVTGLLLTADGAAVAHDPALTAALELLAGQTAVTLAMTATVTELSRQALQDPLTGLANRRVLTDSLQSVVDEGFRSSPSALVLLDLDGFKAVNDQHGHGEGDTVLVGVARRLEACAREGDLVCRLGGDEFAVLVRSVRTAEDAAAVGARFVAAVTDRDSGWHPPVGASAGVRVITGGSPSSILSDADAALYVAKGSGRGQSVLWNPELRQEELAQRSLVHDLRAALHEDGLRLVYQPVVDLRTMRVTGLEALARWDHPTLGVVPPSVFVAAAERAGVVAELTRWVLRTACSQLAQWQGRLNVGINISAAQLADGSVVGDVQRALQASGITPSSLVLEVTETAQVVDLARAKETLEALSGLGVALALDDFGTGYSSLTHAQALPFDILKIDRSFVDAAGLGDRRALATIAAVCALAGRLDVDVVAEGVEDRSRTAELLALGCGYAQGYGFARPMHPQAVTAALSSGGPWALDGPVTGQRALNAVPAPRAVLDEPPLAKAD